MNKLKSTLILPIGLFVSIPVLGNQTNNTEETYVLGSGINSAYISDGNSTLLKNGLSLDETPINMQIVPLAVLVEQDVSSLQDALRNVSGVQANFTMGGAYERFTVRGFMQSIAAYRNGVLQPTARFHRANTESVEVLKGPAALELGMSDPGGAINVVTRKPSKNAQYSFLQTAGSLDEFTTMINASGPVGSNGLLYRIDASWEQYGGYRDVTDNSELFFAPSLALQLSENTDIQFNFEYASSEYTYDQGQHAWEDGLVDLPREQAYGQKDAKQEYDNSTIELIINHTFNDAWSTQVGTVLADSETYFRAIYATGNPSPDDTIVNRSAWFGPEVTDTQSLWATVNGQFHTAGLKHHLTMGIQANQYDYDGSASITFIEQVDILEYQVGDSSINVAEYDNFPKSDFIHTQEDEFNGFFIQDQMYLSERLIMLLGLRHDQMSSKFYDYYGPGGPWISENEVEESATTGRLGFMYKSDNVSPYMSYSTSFGPGFNYLPSAIYEPEEAEQFEAGFKINVLDGQAQLTVSAYKLVKSNIPTPDPVEPNRTVLIGEAESTGLEIDIIGSLSTHWSIMANISFMDTEVTRDFSGNAGNKLPNAPETQGGFWLRYSQGKFALGGGANYVGERYGIASNSYKDDAYTRMDMFAAYEFTLGSFPATARLNLNNITDELYFNMRNRWSNMPSEPFNAVASLNLNF